MIIQLIFSLHLPKRIAHILNAVCEISLIIKSSSSLPCLAGSSFCVYGLHANTCSGVMGWKHPCIHQHSCEPFMKQAMVAVQNLYWRAEFWQPAESSRRSSEMFFLSHRPHGHEWCLQDQNDVSHLVCGTTMSEQTAKGSESSRYRGYKSPHLLPKHNTCKRSLGSYKYLSQTSAVYVSHLSLSPWNHVSALIPHCCLLMLAGCFGCKCVFSPRFGQPPSEFLRASIALRGEDAKKKQPTTNTMLSFDNNSQTQSRLTWCHSLGTRTVMSVSVHVCTLVAFAFLQCSSSYRL